MTDTMGDNITTGSISGDGIAIGNGASVKNYHFYYYPITMHGPLRSVFKPLIEDRVRLFGGRGAILDRIMQRVQEPGGGYTVITAPAGFGKTALMATLVHRTPAAFAYHFFSPIFDGLIEIFFLRNVVQQMAEWHGDKKEIPHDLNDLRGQYFKFLGTPLEHTRVLVLDGLDEVTTWDLKDYLKCRLPDRLHIILTIRDVGQDWQAEYKLPAEQVQHIPLGGLDRDDVMAVLRAAGASAPALADDPGALGKLLTVAAYEADPSLGTDPFYIHLLAEDAAAGQLTTANIGSQPSGLDDYLEQWWRDIRQRVDDQSLRDLLGTLTASFGPIHRTDLEVINLSLVDNWASDFFDTVLQEVRRFVVGNEQLGYALAHPRLRRYLQKKIKVEMYRNQLLAYCARWPEHLSRYALTYYARHLTESGRIEELRATVTDLGFLTTKTFILDAAATERDLLLAEQQLPYDQIVPLLQQRFVQCAHLLDACIDLKTLKATLYSRICHLEILIPLSEAFGRALTQPYLAPVQPLPDLPPPPLVRTLDKHAGEVLGCALSADGALLLSTARDYTLRLWNAHTGILIRTFHGHQEAVWSCAASDNATVVVSASLDRTIRVWDTQTGSLLHVLTGHTAPVRGCAITPDGELIVSASQDTTLKLWNAQTGALIRTFEGHQSLVHACAINRGGTLVVSASEDQTLKLWDINSGAAIYTLEGHTRPVRSCAISADGRLIVSASEDCTLKLWDGQTGTLIQTLEGHTKMVRGCAISADGERAISVGADSTLKVWDTRRGTLMYSVKAHTQWANSCAITPDGTQVVSVGDTLRLWHFPEGDHQRVPDEQAQVNGCAVSGDGRLVVSASDDSTLTLWDAIHGTSIRSLKGHDRMVSACAVSADGALVISASFDGTLRWWDGHTGELRHTKTWKTIQDVTKMRAKGEGRRGVRSCTISADGTIVVSAADDHTLKVWEGTTARLHRSIRMSRNTGVKVCAVSADGTIVVATSWDNAMPWEPKTLRIWDVRTGELRHTLIGHTAQVNACVISNDASLVVSAAADGTLKLWDAQRGELLRTIETGADSLTGCAVSTDKRQVVSVSDTGVLQVWDAASGMGLAALRVGGPLFGCALFPDSTRLVAAGAYGLYWLRLVGMSNAELTDQEKLQ